MINKKISTMTDEYIIFSDYQLQHQILEKLNIKYQSLRITIIHRHT